VILVVSHPGDDHARGVLEVLDGLEHQVVVVDTGQFPVRAALTQRFGTGPPGFELHVDGRTIDLGRCRAGWWRRPLPFALDPDIDAEVASFTYGECHEAVAGLWAALDLAWVNPPELDERAHHKPYQLAVATEVGLPVPTTVITNDPEAARRFVDAHGAHHTVYKTFVATEEHWRETRVLRDGELELLDRVRLAPVIFQELVPAVADVRVTVVGERMFATAISPAPGGYQVDYRMDLAGADFRPTELPGETEKGVRALMQRLGLLYGAVDLRRTPEGGHVFLEVNPAGEWRFVEERTGQPITEAVAHLLVELDRPPAGG
jgi:glutathione synthase/RimK-type ligase-like ATP-grasp enzyme